MIKSEKIDSLCQTNSNSDELFNMQKCVNESFFNNIFDKIKDYKSNSFKFPRKEEFRSEFPMLEAGKEVNDNNSASEDEKLSVKTINCSPNPFEDMSSNYEKKFLPTFNKTSECYGPSRGGLDR